jgi:hypothetical protein
VTATVKRTWATTAEVCAAARITNSTAMKWSANKVLPPYKVVSAGRRGRAARWPLHAPAQAAWVADLMDQGFTFEDIQQALKNGDFRLPAPGTGAEQVHAK